MSEEQFPAREWIYIKETIDDLNAMGGTVEDIFNFLKKNENDLLECRFHLESYAEMFVVFRMGYRKRTDKQLKQYDKDIAKHQADEIKKEEKIRDKEMVELRRLEKKYRR